MGTHQLRHIDGVVQDVGNCVYLLLAELEVFLAKRGVFLVKINIFCFGNVSKLGKITSVKAKKEKAKPICFYFYQ